MLHTPLSLAVFAALALSLLVVTGCASPGSPEPVLRHVVLFKFKSEATPEQIDEIVTAFGALPDEIPEIAGYEYGTDVSPEGLARGFTHAFVLSFETEADRDAYLPHPAHKAFVDKLGPVLDQPLVVDYWTNP
ncbi:MAG: Dabb family protein [Planctomycetota bacterium]